jgi:hypothetical protein
MSQGWKRKQVLICHLMGLTWLQGRKGTPIYQLGRPICNPWGQCCCNIILLFSWNSHQRIKGNLEPNLISFLCYHFISLFIFNFFFSFCACLWMMEGVSNFLIWDMKNVGVLHEKGCVKCKF